MLSSLAIFSHLTTSMHLDLPCSCCPLLFASDRPLAVLALGIHLICQAADKHSIWPTFHHHPHAATLTLPKQHNAPCLAPTILPDFPIRLFLAYHRSQGKQAQRKHTANLQSAHGLQTCRVHTYSRHAQHTKCTRLHAPNAHDYMHPMHTNACTQSIRILSPSTT